MIALVLVAALVAAPPCDRATEPPPGYVVSCSAGVLMPKAHAAELLACRKTCPKRIDAEVRKVRGELQAELDRVTRERDAERKRADALECPPPIPPEVVAWYERPAPWAALAVGLATGYALAR